MKGTGQISIILSICFAVYLGHNLVPHHHHVEVVNVPVGSQCPVEHENPHCGDHETEGHPIHCHAFNDVVFNKYKVLEVVHHSRAIISIAATGAAGIPDFPVIDDSFRYSFLKIPDLVVDYFGARSLRAPPQSA